MSFLGVVFAVGLALDVTAVLPPLPPPVPPPAGDAAWKTLKTVDGVVLREAPSGRPKAPWGMGEGEIAAPLDVVISHLLDFGELTRFIPRLQTAQVLRLDGSEAVVYFRFDLPWPISDRDFTARYQFGKDAAGAWHMQWVDANELGPPAKRTVRLSPQRGEWELSATERGTTRVRYVFLAELGGYITKGIVEQTVWKEPLQTIQGVRKALGVK